MKNKAIKLSARQLECARLLLTGAQYKEIAWELELSVRTVEMHIEYLKHKFSSRNKTELILQLSQFLQNNSEPLP